MARRIAIVLATILAALGMVFAGALIWVTSKSGAQFMSNELESAIRENSDLDVSLKELSSTSFLLVFACKKSRRET